MNKSLSSLLLLTLICCGPLAAQIAEATYNVTSGNGNGLRFWSSDNYKIHMGNTSLYQYGPVSDYSVKMNMSNQSDRGWTWGIYNQTPIAALNTQGEMQIAGRFTGMSGLRTGDGRVQSSINSIRLQEGVGSDDNNYEWVGFYSGSQRQGIILYDGPWTGANNLSDEFSITAQNGNKLTLNTDGDHIALMPDGSGNVGIGTTNPAEMLHLLKQDAGYSIRMERTGMYTGYGDLTFARRNSNLGFFFDSDQGSSLMTVLGSGEVGIGTSSPAYQLTVNTSDEKHLRFENDGEYSFLKLHDNGDLNIWAHGTDNILFTNGDGVGTEVMRIDAIGNIGIGTTSPTEKLTVDGNIRAEEVKVEVVNGPDYVFEPDYDLPSLKEIETYIQAHKHLPEIPSAEEMDENGVELGVMNMLLLKKIEELTLHIIRINGHQQELMEANKSLRQRLEQIEEDQSVRQN